MDYFNFYIIKKFIKKYKKFIFIFLCFLLILFIKNKVFATFSFEYDGTYYNLPDLPLNSDQASGYDGYFMFTDGGYIRLVYCPPQTRVYYSDSNGRLIVNCAALSNGRSIVAYSTTNSGSGWSTWSLSKDNSGCYFSSFNATNTATRHIIYSDLDIYNGQTGSSIYFESSVNEWNPYIINTERISSWSFSTLNISGGSQFQANLPARTDFTLFIYFANNYFSMDIKPYMQYVDIYNHVIFYVPRQKLLTNYNIVGDEVLDFELKTVYHDPHSSEVITDYWDLGSYQLDIDSATAGEINSNADKELLTNIDDSINEQTEVIEHQTEVIEEQTDAIEETTEAVESLENTITDDTIESGAEDLPSTNVQDPTQNGIDNIFQSIYNAFCTGQAQDIVFPIPFTNKNITLSPYYVRDMLNNNGASWVYTLIQAFWGYLIGRYIVKDISKKITKIKGGDIENIENNNIKEDML